MAERIETEIDNDVNDIAGVVSLIENFGGRHLLPKETVFHLTLACDEMLTNIISYGFPDEWLHKIRISIALEGSVIETEIVDDGIAFDPLSRPKPDINLPLEERKNGGLGIHFVRTVMDRVDYHRSKGLNHLKMVLQVPASPAKGENP